MKLFKLSQTVNNDWDTFDSCIVCAENEEDAKSIHPDGDSDILTEGGYSWTNSFADITCAEIGVANEDQKRGVICSSFNAG